MNITKVVTYWKTTAEEDWRVANSLFKLKHYAACLFYCHLTLEKLLKGLVVLHTKDHAPYIHNLVRLSETAELLLTLAEKEQLTTINQFNISGRYDDIKLALHKKANAKFTKHYLELTKTHYLWLKKLYQKK